MGDSNKKIRYWEYMYVRQNEDHSRYWTDLDNSIKFQINLKLNEN